MPALETIFIVGPTGCGKSAVAVEVAKRVGGEIVGADAFQVYRGLDVLTAKPDAGALAQVPHHLIGEIPRSDTFDVARFRALAEERIAEIAARGLVPVVAGGTGLYVRALTHGLAELPGADAELRARLEAQPLEELAAELQRRDPEAQIDFKNPRRVVRALEVCLLTGKPFSSFREQAEPTRPIRGVVLVRDREQLQARINRRTVEMFASGVAEEVRGAGEVSATAAQAIGFREIQAMLRGEIGEAECVAQIQQQTRQYAKRQMTWFRREKHFATVDVAEDETAGGIAERVVSLCGSS